MSAQKKLLLWDIDGTLVTTGQAGVGSLVRSLKEKFGVDGGLGKVDLRGRTDRLISGWILEENGIEPTPENCQKFSEGYLEALATELPAREGNVYPGIFEILEKADARPDLVNALLTGNLERGAQLKLTHYKVWHYFEFGAFADDSMHRNELGPHAVRRAREKHDVEFPPENVFIIGDTPHDIECGKVIGAHTIAVCTGGYPKDKLASHQPTALFEDLSDIDAFFEVIDSN